MSRFVDTVPDRARTAIYIAAFLVAVEIVASLLAAGLAVVVFSLDEGIITDPLAVLEIFAAFQTFITAEEAVSFAIYSISTTASATVVGIVTTLYVVSGLGLWRVLGRVGIASSRDVDQWFEDRHA